MVDRPHPALARAVLKKTYNVAAWMAGGIRIRIVVIDDDDDDRYTTTTAHVLELKITPLEPLSSSLTKSVLKLTP